MQVTPLTLSTSTHPQLPRVRSPEGIMPLPRYVDSIPVGSEVAHRAVPMLATVRRSNCTRGFPACSFHEDSYFRDAIEGIN
jgi:hypothetical protein